ncbi:hypothetical protein Thpro_023197 [Acidihalobacter prosperus]|uniref:Uncharacterized protein n=1 Tax=Acidihalobacter prosperus TaxID=160660 RepID=A0A1A6BZY8_9GAMM|nr:hypothetical protein Thpro_023197 [Acidihalobacter prosperus]
MARILRANCVSHKAHGATIWVAWPLTRETAKASIAHMA